MSTMEMEYWFHLFLATLHVYSFFLGFFLTLGHLLLSKRIVYFFYRLILRNKIMFISLTIAVYLTFTICIYLFMAPSEFDLYLLIHYFSFDVIVIIWVIFFLLLQQS